MTFYEPESGVFGALGHAVTDADTGKLMPMLSGSIMDARVKAVKKGESGAPGELRGDFDLTHDSGSLRANTECGIFGVLAENAADAAAKTVPVASRGEIHPGRATLLANCRDDEVEEYGIEIEKIYSGPSPTRNLLLRVTDPRLLERTGGIVQGMSGSPILQGGKLVGAVTHVLLNDPTRGYGISIRDMLDAAAA
jgi:stage IV sporulation protein B